MVIISEQTENSMINELRHKLKHGIVSFTYRKKDGTLRHSHGTQSSQYLTENFPNALPNGNGSSTPGICKYFDTDKNA